MNDPATATLIRTEMTGDYTLGVLAIEGARFPVLERPWLNNRANRSCIPAGTYNATFMARSSSGRYKRVYWIRQVPDRGGILIHAGNVVSNSLGCLLIGRRTGWLKGKRAVLNSRSALREFGAILNERRLKLTIIEQCSGA